MRPSDVDDWLIDHHAHQPGAAWTVWGDGHAATVCLVGEDDVRRMGHVQTHADLEALCGVPVELDPSDPLRALADWSLADLLRQRVLTSELIDYLRGEHE